VHPRLRRDVAPRVTQPPSRMPLTVCRERRVTRLSCAIRCKEQPETMDRTWHALPTATGWSFATRPDAHASWLRLAKIRARLLSPVVPSPSRSHPDCGQRKVPKLGQARLGEGTMMPTAFVAISYDVKEPTSLVPRRIGVRSRARMQFLAWLRVVVNKNMRNVVKKMRTNLSTPL